MVFDEVFLSFDDCWTERKWPHDCQQLLDTSDVLVFGIQREAIPEFCTHNHHYSMTTHIMWRAKTTSLLVFLFNKKQEQNSAVNRH